MARTAWLAAVVAAAGVASAGCGKTDPPAAATVRGAVTFAGRPLAGGMVVFTPDREKGTAGRAVSATVAPDGGYRLVPDGAAGVAPGWYRVAIADPPGMFGTESSGPSFPAALRRPDRSGLSREVKAGQDHVLNFDIDVTE